MVSPPLPFCSFGQRVWLLIHKRRGARSRFSSFSIHERAHSIMEQEADTIKFAISCPHLIHIPEDSCDTESGGRVGSRGPPSHLSAHLGPWPPPSRLLHPSGAKATLTVLPVILPVAGLPSGEWKRETLHDYLQLIICQSIFITLMGINMLLYVVNEDENRLLCLSSWAFRRKDFVNKEQECSKQMLQGTQRPMIP